MINVYLGLNKYRRKHIHPHSAATNN